MPTENMIFPNRFQFEDVPDLTGRVALVTGGSAGIGYNVALALALANAHVLIASYTEERGLEALSKIKEAIADRSASNPNSQKGSVEYHQLDFGSLKEVRALGAKILKDHERLDLFMGVAGIGVAPFGLTSDGIGNHFQVNNLSQFVLVNQLLPLMERTSDRKDVLPNSVRFVTLASELHKTSRADIKFQNVEEVSVEDDANRLYARSKLGSILLVKQLAKRKLAPNGNKVLAIAVHPGGVATDQQEGLVESYGLVGKVIKETVKPFLKSPEQGCESAIWAATAVGLTPEGYQGEYFTESMGKPGSETNQAKDEQLGDSFWALCEKCASEH